MWPEHKKIKADDKIMQLKVGMENGMKCFFMIESFFRFFTRKPFSYDLPFFDTGQTYKSHRAQVSDG